MAYTTIDKPSDYFETVLWSSVDTSIDTLDFQPDWVWIKSRTNADTQVLFDSVRGAGERLSSSSTGAESTKTDELTAFNSDGFTLGTGSNVNRASNNNVAWNWKAGTSFTNDASSTGIGSIDSAGSVNNDAGFSICTHTGTGSNATIKHGLSTAPKMIITKKRSASGGWQVGHESIGWQNGIYLEDTSASTGDAGAWNSTAPTSSIFYVGTSSFTNQSSATYVSYIFAEKQGYSKIGSYIGNGNADGIFVYTGFKPAFFICKRYNDSGYDWLMYDNKRQVSFNVVDDFLKPNLNDAETTGNANQSLDFLSNGVKHRGNGASSNGSGASYIYYAVAENPFVTSTGVPATAR